MKEKRTYKLLPISNAISKVYKNSSGQNDSHFISLMKNWEKVMGKEYSKILFPIKVSSKTATLTISSERNFSLESNYIAPMILDKVNNFYGYKAFRKINFVFKKKELSQKTKNTVLNTETKDKIEKIVCNINNDALKESLDTLGKSMAKKGKLK